MSAPGTASPAGPAPTSPSTTAGSHPLPPWAAPAALFALLMVAYLMDGIPPVRDATPNVCLSVELLKYGSMSFAPLEAPFMYTWEFQGKTRTRRVYVGSWDRILEGRRARDLYASGLLSRPEPFYYLLPSKHEGRHVGIYGPGSGLTAVPYFALLALVYRGWCDNMDVLGMESKFFAGACVAASAVAVYLTLLLFVSRPAAWVGGGIYGLGTCVWPELTQSLWQQTPVLPFVAFAVYFLARPPGNRIWTALAGVCAGGAVMCRPTLAIFLVTLGGYVAWKRRRELAAFLLAAAIPILVLLSFNAVYLGSPLRTGQSEAARVVARAFSGTDDVWSTPLWEGAAGVLISPSRGLFVFSPFLAFAVWGAIEAWRRPGFELFRALSLAVVGLLLIASKWFEWFGGWVYGYRLVAEVAPLLTICLAPVAAKIQNSKPRLALFGALAALSIGIQALGVFRYDPVGWHGRHAYEVQVKGEAAARILEDVEEAKELVRSGRANPVRELVMDVNEPRFRWRLWSVSRGQLASLLERDAADDARMSRQELMDAARDDKMGLPNQ